PQEQIYCNALQLQAFMNKPVTLLRNKFLELRCLHNGFEIKSLTGQVLVRFWSFPIYFEPFPTFQMVASLKQWSRNFPARRVITGQAFHEVSRYPRDVRRHRKMARKV